MNYLVFIATILKQLYFVFTRYLINTHYLEPRGKRLKCLFSVNLSQDLYAVKCIFKESPIRMFIVLYLTGFFFFAFAFQITESRVPIESNPFRLFWNSVWFTFITASTVGYGDIRPFTNLGYILDICCMTWGTLIMSCILVVLTNTLTINPKEEEALSVLKNIQINIKYRYISKLYVRETVWRWWTNRKHRIHKREPLRQRKMRQKLFRLRSQKKLMNPSTNFLEMSQRQFDICTNHAEVLHANNIDLINYIGSHIFSEGLIRERDQSSKCFIDRSKEKELEDSFSDSSNGDRNSQDSSNSEPRPVSQKSIIKSLSSFSSHSEQSAAVPLIGPNNAQCIKSQDLKSKQQLNSEQLIKEEGI